MSRLWLMYKATILWYDNGLNVRTSAYNRTRKRFNEKRCYENLARGRRKKNHKTYRPRVISNDMLNIWDSESIDIVIRSDTTEIDRLEVSTDLLLSFTKEQWIILYLPQNWPSKPIAAVCDKTIRATDNIFILISTLIFVYVSTIRDNVFSYDMTKFPFVLNKYWRCLITVSLYFL